MNDTRYMSRFICMTICAVVVLLLSSCENMNVPESGKTQPFEGATTVVLHVAASSFTGRIITPETPAVVANYRLFGTLEGGTIQELGSWDSLNDATITLAVGTWDFVLDAYDGSGNLVLEGRIDACDISGGATLSFELTLVETGTGSVRVMILWPYLDRLVTSVVTTFDGNPVAPQLEPVPVPPAGLAAIFEKTDVAAGDYLLTFKLLNANGTAVCTRSEWVLVRGNVQSEGTILVDESDFNRAPESPGNCGIINEGTLGWSSLSFTLAWSDSSDNETGFLVKSSEDGETWVTETSVGAGVTTYPTSLKRGESRAYRISAFNDFGTSEPATTDYEVPALIDLMTSDSEIMTVTVNLWDPGTLAFHGTFEFTRCGSFFKGGGEPTTLGPQLIQAYAYDAEGKIRGVAEATESIVNFSDQVTMIIQPAHLMGGNVQKTGGSISETPVLISRDEIGIDNTEYTGVYGMACDGLNLYFIDNVGGLVRRQVISSKAVAVFAGGGAGFDESNPGQSPTFPAGDIYGLTTDGKHLYVGSQMSMSIYRLSYAASTKTLINFSGDPSQMYSWLVATDGDYLYIGDLQLHRLDLKTLVLSHLNPTDWSWSTTWNPAYGSELYVWHGIMTNGEKIFWRTYPDSFIKSMSINGGDAAVLQDSTSFEGMMTTDGLYIYLCSPRKLPDGTYEQYGEVSYIYKIHSVTGTSTVIGTVSGLFAHTITTDGLSLFIVKN
jgi:hypothetical protein